MSIQNGAPEVKRNDRFSLDMYRWPDGRWVRIHDNGNITVGQPRYEAKVESVRNYTKGNQGSVVAIELTEQATS